MMKQVMIHMLLVVDGILMILLNDTFDLILCCLPQKGGNGIRKMAGFNFHILHVCKS